MKRILFDLADIIILASGALWVIIGTWSGISLIQLSGTFSEFGGKMSPLIGIVVIVGSVLIGALHSLICYILLDIRTYIRHTAKMVSNR